MQPSVQLYPAAVSYSNGVSYDASIGFNVPNMGTPIAIKKVHLVGKEIFMLCQVSEKRSMLCAIGFSEDKKTVTLPAGTNVTNIKVNRYVLGRTWGWTDSTHFDINFIQDENVYNKKVGE